MHWFDITFPFCWQCHIAIGADIGVLCYVHTSTLDLFYITDSSSLFSWSMTMTVHRRKPSVKCSVPLHVDFVRVGGRYRVGKLIGSGGSGEYNSESDSIQLSELSRECLFRERYPDGSWNCCEDRACRPPVFKAQIWIQHVYGNCWQHRYLSSTLVWEGRLVRSYHLGSSWGLTCWFDQQRTDCVMNSLFLNSDSLVCLDKVYSDSGERGTKARDDQGG